MKKETHFETDMIHSDYDLTVEYFQNIGWKVEIGKRSELTAASNEIWCGDGRFANIKASLRKVGRALFGGLWGVAAMKTGGNKQGVEKAAALIRSKGYTPTTHGDEHGVFSCGLFNKWKEHALDAIQGIFQFALPDANEAIAELCKSLNIPAYILPGHHEEEKVVISFVPGKTPKLDTRYFRLNGELATEFEIPLQIYLETASAAVESLTNGRVKTIRIIGQFPA